jgi:hypothetical protein
MIIGGGSMLTKGFGNRYEWARRISEAIGWVLSSKDE